VVRARVPLCTEVAGDGVQVLPVSSHHPGPGGQHPFEERIPFTGGIFPGFRGFFCSPGCPGLWPDSFFIPVFIPKKKSSGMKSDEQLIDSITSGICFITPIFSLKTGAHLFFGMFRSKHSPVCSDPHARQFQSLFSWVILTTFHSIF
jgi:hypothetical protein